QDFFAGGSVERSAFGVFDAGIGVERGLFAAARVVDALGAGEGIDILVIEMEVSGKRTEFAGFGNSGVGVFRTDLREFQRGLQHALDAGGGKIAGVGAGGALPKE